MFHWFGFSFVEWSCCIELTEKLLLKKIIIAQNILSLAWSFYSTLIFLNLFLKNAIENIFKTLKQVGRLYHTAVTVLFRADYKGNADEKKKKKKKIWKKKITYKYSRYGFTCIV